MRLFCSLWYSTVGLDIIGFRVSVCGKECNDDEFAWAYVNDVEVFCNQFCKACVRQGQEVAACGAFECASRTSLSAAEFFLLFALLSGVLFMRGFGGVFEVWGEMNG